MASVVFSGNFIPCQGMCGHNQILHGDWISEIYHHGFASKGCTACLMENGICMVIYHDISIYLYIPYSMEYMVCRMLVFHGDHKVVHSAVSRGEIPQLIPAALENSGVQPTCMLLEGLHTFPKHQEPGCVG